ncbi:hypothetical protein [Paraglaciecola hydrolytica]|uniref:Uncharacterized protein n=1 Tax=Paraglaciecola hydrolytica TaxID=1799789 RepID=A0A148KMS8_9ALTE|nr:hypothetical protein [Paraglaciecola hydrolytica]KXI27612.1 hypothetical protein AX660_18800 [Paraglaciecola hydrolytica]
MFARVYLPPFITALFGGLFIAIGISTFGDADTFDRLFVGILIFTLIICRKNIDIVSLLAIIFIQRISQELAWVGLSDSDVLKELLYCLAIIMIYALRHDPLVKWMAIIIAMAISAEIYWNISDYPAPELFWHLILLLSCLLTRYMIFSRVDLVQRYLTRTSESTNLDWIYYKLFGTTAIVQAAAIFEYLLRHILGLSQVLVIYYAYPYIVHGIATFSIWATFHESYKQLLPRLLKA